MRPFSWLSAFPKITHQRARKLASFFADPQKIFQAEITELIQAGLEPNIADEFIKFREENPPEKLTALWNQLDVKTVCLDESDYPYLLKQITDPPLTLFYRGSLSSLSNPTLAIVGTRHCSSYGQQITTALSQNLSQQGLTIVSGLALGIDGFAHQGALNVNGATVAVLGSGVDDATIYPRGHYQLAQSIIKSGGAVISEYPPQFSPTQYSFPLRNRIIAGLSLGTLVTEAPIKSGALITARVALDYNREVFAVPHPITSLSGQGNNELLKKGAALVTTYEDVLNLLEITALKQPPLPKLSSLSLVEQKIIAALANEPKSIDEITKLSGLTCATVMSNLTVMELKGKVKNLGGTSYTKTMS